MSTHQVRLCLCSVLAAVVSASPLAAQTKPKILETGIERPTSRILIGDSFFYYNNSLHNHFALLLRSADADYKFRATSVTISGVAFASSPNSLLGVRWPFLGASATTIGFLTPFFFSEVRIMLTQIS